jgi:protein-arginine kinase activator protein McsA
MRTAAKELNFEKAALLRDQIVELRRTMQGEEESVVPREWLKTR